MLVPRQNPPESSASPGPTSPQPSSTPPSPVGASPSPTTSVTPVADANSSSSSSGPPPSSSSSSESSSSSSSSDSPPSSSSSSSSSSTSQSSSSASSSSTSITSSTESLSSSSSTTSSSDERPSSTTSQQTTHTSPPARPSTARLSTSFSTTEIVTTIDNQVTTITSVTPIPTSLSDSPQGRTDSRTAMIAGTTTGVAVFLLLLALGAVFLYRRHQRKQFGFIESIVSRHKQATGRARLLEGEDMDEDDSVPMSRYRDSDPHSREMSTLSAMSQHTFGSTGSPLPTHPASPAPSLFRARASETGSIFREEGVWPPPAELVDPLARSIGAGEGLGIGDAQNASGGLSDQNRPTSSGFNTAGAAVVGVAGSVTMAATALSDPYAPSYSRAANDTGTLAEASTDPRVQTGVLKMTNPSANESAESLVGPYPPNPLVPSSGSGPSRSQTGESTQYSSILSALDEIPPPSYTPASHSPLAQSPTFVPPSASVRPPSHRNSGATSISVYSTNSVGPTGGPDVFSTSPTAERPLSTSGLPPGAAAPRYPQALANVDQDADLVSLGDGWNNTLPTNLFDNGTRR